MTNNNSIIIQAMPRTVLCAFFCMVLVLIMQVPWTIASGSSTVIVSAEGLVDPNADMYKHDKGIMIDDLRNDAKRQALEKVVGIYVNSSTLVENYILINDTVLTQSKGFIKKIHKESSPWLGKDGLMHMLIKAEVFKKNTKEALRELSQKNRALKLREAGDPRISVAIMVQDADRASSTPPVRSDIAENIFKDQLSQFGYRVWSEDIATEINQGREHISKAKGKKVLAAFYSQKKEADFSIKGSVRFQPIFLTMKKSGFKIKKYALNSWTVKCYDTHTGEELYYNNNIPEAKSWPKEDKALLDIGKMISDEFSVDFFAKHLVDSLTRYQLIIEGLPSYDTASLLKKELIGLRPVLNVDLHSFDIDGAALFEVEFTGNRNHFAQTINSAVIKPLNAKLGTENFQLAGMQGRVVRLQFVTDKDSKAVTEAFEATPPSSLATAPASRVKGLVHSKDIEKSIKAMNSALSRQADKQPEKKQSKTISEIGNF